MPSTPLTINDFTAWKRLISLALPMAGTTFLNAGSGFLCMAMVAALGHTVLAASALIFSTELAVIVSGISILFSVSVLVGRAYGAKDYPSVGTTLQQAWVLALVISIPFMLFFWNVGRLFQYVGAPPQLLGYITSYFHAFVFAVLPNFLGTCNIQVSYGLHKKRLVVTVGILSMVVLLVSAYALIFGKWGLPALGVAGLAYATALQYAFFFVVTTLFFRFEPSFHKFEMFRFRVHEHLDHFKKMLEVGWPISVQMGGEMLSFFVSGIMMGWLGVNALAAFQIVNQYYFLIIIPVFSLSQASGILIGNACGAKQFHEVNVLSRVTLFTVLGVSAVIALVFLGLPKLLASAYLDVVNPANALTVHYTVLIFAIIAFSQLFDNVRNALIGMLRGMLDTRFAMFTSVFCIWVFGMPLTYTLAFVLHLGVGGFVTGGALGMLACVALMFYRWKVVSARFIRLE